MSNPAILPLFWYAVEERQKLIEVLLGNRIVLVFVAASAAKGHSHPNTRRGFYPIDQILHEILFWYNASFVIDPMITIKPRRDLLID